MSGTRADDVTDLFDQVSKDAKNEILFVLHMGTNDERKARCEDLLDKYRKLIELCKTKSSQITILGVFPRIATANVFYSKAFRLNNRLETICKEHGIEFVNMWNDFYNNRGFFKEDILHLSPVGAARYGNCLAKLSGDSGKKTEAVCKSSGLPSKHQRQSNRLPSDSRRTML